MQKKAVFLVFINISAICMAFPAIEVSPSELTFEVLEAAPNPTPQNIYISNTGTGKLKWEITESCPWLDVTPTSGTCLDETDSVAIAVDITGLPGGTYTTQLTITDPDATNSPQYVTVTLEITGPIIQVSPTSIRFDAVRGQPNPAPQTFTIQNTGGGVINWTVDYESEWLFVSPTSGSIGVGESMPITLSVDATSLSLPFMFYYCALSITDPAAANSPRYVNVFLYITGPILNVWPTTIDFAADEGQPNPAPQSITIQNAGDGTLNWTADYESDWLNVSPTSGSVPAGESTPVTLSADITSLTGISYSSQIIISDPIASDSPQTVTANLSINKTTFFVPSSDFPTIQSAIDASDNGDTIIISPGTYYERINFDGKGIILRSIDPNDSAIVESTIIDANGSGSVVVFSDTENCQLKGFTITHGDRGISGGTDSVLISNCIITKNSGSWGGSLSYFDGVIKNSTISNNTASYGGGFYYGNCTIDNCVISNNTSLSYGGGFCNCTSKIYNSIISNNTASYGGGFYHCTSKIYNSIISNNTASYGGGFYSCVGTIENCVISNNTASYGGGMYNDISSPKIFNSFFENNQATYNGGGIHNYHYSDPEIENCVFFNNSAEKGGAIYNRSWTDMTLVNCTFKDNTAQIADGMYNDYMCYPVVTDCIFWNDSPSEIYDETESESTLSYCNVKGGWPGTGNINIDPRFLDDYHLAYDSPCIDAGDPSCTYDPDMRDIDGDPRVAYRIDIGADEVFASDCAALFVSPSNLEFIAVGIDDNPAPQTIELSNYGTNDLNWQVINDCQWLSITPQSGQTESLQTNQITVTAHNDHTIYGMRSCEFQIHDPNADNSPQVITVTLDVLGPEIEVSPESFSFECDVDDPNTISRILSISNTGYDTLNWQIIIPPDCQWLTAEPMSGISTPGGPAEVILTADPAGYDIGLYTIELTVTDPQANNVPFIVPVTLHIYTPGEIHVPAEYVTIGEAVDVAMEGDHIIIHPGTYSSWQDNSIGFNDKAITVRSIDPNDLEIVASTIIKGGYTNGWQFELDNGHSTVVNGLTFRQFFGRIISCYENSPTIQNCVFTDSFVYFEADSLIYCRESSARVINCTMIGNIVLDGGSIFVSNINSGGTVTIDNCLISNRYQVRDYHNVLSPIYVAFCNANITNTTIAFNTHDEDPEYYSDYPGFYPGIMSYCGDVSIRNSIVWGNRGIDNTQIAVVQSSMKDGYPGPAILNVSYSDVEGGLDNVMVFPDDQSFENFFEDGILPDPNLVDPNGIIWGEGNIDADPLFVREPNDGGDGWMDNYQTEEINEALNNDNGDMHLKSEAGRYLWEGFSRADFNKDKAVNLSDFAIMAEDWLEIYNYYSFEDWDIDGDWEVEIDDLILFCEDYLQVRIFGECIIDDVTSPCIDAGDPADMNYQLEPLPNGDIINMGAYGGTEQASKSVQ